MLFRLLGRPELVNGNGAIALPGAVSRALVGRLLLAHGAVVRRDTLIEELWEERGAKDPVNALQVQMAKLRSALAAGGEDTRLLFGHGGYRIVLGPDDEIDATAFEAGLRAGREHLARTQGGLLEPLARHAVGVLLDRLDAHHRSGASGQGGTDQVRAWLADGPSVLAALC